MDMSVLDGLEENLYELLTSDKKVVTQAGVALTLREYLDAFLDTMQLPSCDYGTALKLLRMIAEGHDPETLVGQVRGFWTSLDSTKPR